MCVYGLRHRGVFVEASCEHFRAMFECQGIKHNLYTNKEFECKGDLTRWYGSMTQNCFCLAKKKHGVCVVCGLISPESPGSLPLNPKHMCYGCFNDEIREQHGEDHHLCTGWGCQIMAEAHRQTKMKAIAAGWVDERLKRPPQPWPVPHGPATCVLGSPAYASSE